MAADATDDVGVAGVQFTLNGLDLGIRVTTSPYSLSWDTTTISDGRHSLGSVATDLSGNSTLATPITVTVDNATVQAVVGSWSAPVDIGMVAVNMVLLHTGKILMYRGEDQGGVDASAEPIYQYLLFGPRGAGRREDPGGRGARHEHRPRR